MPTSEQPTILLTGATGFLGSHLLRGLLDSGASIIVLKRSWSDTWRIRGQLAEVAAYDIDQTPLRDVFEAHSIDVVIHTATSYGRKGESVSELMDANVRYPLQLLELAAEFHAPHFFNTDSFSTKGDELAEGLQYYTLSKTHLREYGHAFAGANFIQFTNVQIEHMYGPDDDETKFVPTAIRTLQANQPSFALTPGEQRRDFVYVDDVVAAFLTLLAHRSTLPRPTLHVEVGSGVSEPLKHAVELMRELCASETRLLFGALEYRKGELMASRADTAVLRELGWMARVSLRDGLERTIGHDRSAVKANTPGDSMNAGLRK